MPRPPLPGPKLPPPPPRSYPRARRRSQPSYLAVGLGVLALVVLVLGVVAVASLTNPNPNPESGILPEPVATQPLSGPPFQMAQPVPPAPVTAAPEPQPAEPAPAVTVRGLAQDVIAQVKPSVVLIIAAREGEISSGSGFVVSNSQVATCHHVLASSTRLMIVTADGQQTPATLTAADPERDLAVLSCAGPLPPPLTLGDSDRVRDGDEIAVTGFPVVSKFLNLGYEPMPSTTRGTVSASRRREVGPGVEVEELQIDAAINAGNSGGPVYSTRDGSVLGIATSKLALEQNIGFAVSVNTLRRLLGR